MCAFVGMRLCLYTWKSMHIYIYSLSVWWCLLDKADLRSFCFLRLFFFLSFLVGFSCHHFKQCCCKSCLLHTHHQAKNFKRFYCTKNISFTGDFWSYSLLSVLHSASNKGEARWWQRLLDLVCWLLYWHLAYRCSYLFACFLNSSHTTPVSLAWVVTHGMFAMFSF